MTNTTNTNTTNTTPEDPSLSAMWPWMKDAKSRIENPIAPLDEYDHREQVKDLIAKHRASIDKMKTQLQQQSSLYQPVKHDDLWLLRYYLSHGREDKAVEAATATLKFRQEHDLDEWDFRSVQVTAACIRENAESLPAFAQSAAKMLDCYNDENTILYTIPDAQRGVVGFLQLAGRNQHKMARTLSDQEYFEAHLFFSEWKFQWMDYQTRITGRLTKYVSICDLHGVCRKMIHKESKKKDSNAAKVMEDKYPQLLGSMLIVHAPTWMSVIFALLKPFAPKRLLEKVSVIQPASKHKDLTRLLEYCSPEHLPEQYGGKLEGWPPQSVLPKIDY